MISTNTLLIILFLSTLFPFSGPRVSLAAQSDTDLEQKALAFIEQLAQGQYSEATAPFDEAMLKALPAERLQSIWSNLLDTYGAYQSTGKVEVLPAGEHTAVIVETHFERGVINLRVVFNDAGQISGFFYVPVRLTGGISPWSTAAVGFTALFTILYPIVLAVIARRRLGTSWRVFALGMGIFVIFQLATRIPVISVVEAFFGTQIRSSQWLFAGWLVLLCITAGLFEETGRYVGYRWMMPRDAKTWPLAVMFGLGHGGIESILLVGVNNLLSFFVLLFYPAARRLLPAEIGGVLAQQVAALSAYPDWFPLLAAWERLWTLPVHVALAVVVLQAFRRANIRWLWLAILLHAAVNLIVVGLPALIKLPGSGGSLLASALVFLIGVCAVWAIFSLRDAKTQELANPLPEG